MIRSPQSHLHIAALSHPGMSGKNNEDRVAIASYYLSEEDRRPSVFAVVADGIGGHQAGEVAAELAVNFICKTVAESNGKKPLKILENAIHEASQAIAEHSAGKAEQEGMGSTCVCAWVIEDKLYIAHVGDSRIYLIRDQYIRRITTDHTWVQEAIEKGVITPEEARNHPNVHVIRRHLGGVQLPEVDFRLKLTDEETDELARSNQGLSLDPTDTVLLCSDGLTDLVWDDEIFYMVRSRNEVKSAAEALVKLANKRGGHDNITVALISMANLEAVIKKKLSFFDWLLGDE